LFLGTLREHPGRFALAVLAIALGVALGIAVHLVNSSAVGEFELAARHLAGEADLIVRGPRAGFDEALYPRLARLAQIEAANPALDLEVPVAGHQDSLRIFAFDSLRAVQVQPALLPERSGQVLDLFDADAVLLSPSAAQWLGLKAGDTLKVQVGTRLVPLKVTGLLPEGAYRQRIGVMDIAAAQWRLDQLGRLNRIDLRLRPGSNVASLRRELKSVLPPGVQVLSPESEGERGANLTRAYRLNLDMLALVALFTGAFLVYSSQVLTILRRRTQLALLRAIGVTRRELLSRLLAEGAAIGIAGSSLGVLLGYGLARLLVSLVGGDLGAGYFRTVTTSLDVDLRALAGFFALGVLFAVLGAAVPAWEAVRRPPAQALRSGDVEESSAASRAHLWAIVSFAIGSLLAQAPPIREMPIAGYLAISFVLLGAVLAMPWIARRVLALIPSPARAPTAIAVAQLKATPRQAALSVAAIVTSFSLMVSMLIMVSSFRASFETWLEQLLPSDLHLRAARFGETAFLSPDEQRRIAATPGVDRVEFLRTRTLLLAPERPPVALLAGPVSVEAPDRFLPMVSLSQSVAPRDVLPVWVSEAVADLYGFNVGDRVQLPIGDVPGLYTVAGIWRDYVRQGGAIAINRKQYEKLTGDSLVNEADVWLASGTTPDNVQQALRQALQGAALEISTTREIRAISLKAFDRTFAVTYVLEVVAVVIGLFGVSVSFGAQAIARRREFGVLRHLGMMQREIGVMLGWEGAIVAAIGALFGLATGTAIGLVLVHVVNRQSFHWSMKLHMPWLSLATLAAFVVTAAIATAVWSGRAAMSGSVVGAVREDW
jgi:putative ABC transport system permease protein